MKYSKTEEEVLKLLEPIISEMSKTPDEEGELHAYEIVDVEYVKEGSDYHLRGYIDKDTGISVDDCEAISRKLEAVLDEKDPIKEAYILEISSPGLTRALKREKDYERNINKPIEVHLYRPVEVEGISKKGKPVKEKVKIFIGDLRSYNEETISIDIGEDKEEIIEIERNNISSIKQYFVF